MNIAWGIQDVGAGIWCYRESLGAWHWLATALVQGGLLAPCPVACADFSPPANKPTYTPTTCATLLPNISMDPEIDRRLTASDLQDFLDDQAKTASLAPLLGPLTKPTVNVKTFAQLWYDAFQQEDAVLPTIDQALEDLMKQFLPPELRQYLDVFEKNTKQDLVVPPYLFQISPGDRAAMIEAIRKGAEKLLGVPIPDGPLDHPRGTKEPRVHIPGCNPVYPTDRGLRDPNPTERRRYAYYYGWARRLCYQCTNLPELDTWRESVPQSMGALYAHGNVDDALELMTTLTAQLKQIAQDKGIDLRTCTHLATPTPQPPPPPAPPPPPPPGPKTYWAIPLVYNNQNYLPTVCATGQADAEAQVSAIFPGADLWFFIDTQGALHPTPYAGIGGGNTGTPC